MLKFRLICALMMCFYFIPLVFTEDCHAASNPFGIWLGAPRDNLENDVCSFNVNMIHGHVYWSKFEPSDDDYRFDYYDGELSRWEDEGIVVSWVMKIGRLWATGDPDTLNFGDQKPSHVPVDLFDEWNSTYGYCPSYYDYIHRFVLFCNTPIRRINHIIICAEPESPSWFTGSASEYTRLLKTAYKAAKDADPDIHVVLGGTSSSGMGMVLIREMLERHSEEGAFTEDEILRFANGYHNRKSYGNFWNSYDRMVEEITDPDSFGRPYDFLTHVIDNLRIDELPGEPLAIDIVNFHFYEEYTYLKPIIDWFNYRLCTVNDYHPLPVGSAQSGVRVPKVWIEGEGPVMDPEYEKSPECARDHVKYLIEALYRRMIKVIHFQMHKSETYLMDKASLCGFYGDEKSWNPSAQGVRTVTILIGEEYIPSQGVPLRENGVRIYPFVSRSNPGREPLFVGWSESESPVNICIDIPERYRRIRKLDFRGESEDIPLQGDGIFEEEFTAEPFFYLLLDDVSTVVTKER
jgi:hypothetical protein